MLIVLAVVFLGIVGFIKIRDYTVQQQTIHELNQVSNDLQVVYDKLLEANKGNVTNSEFGKICSESSTEVGRGTIACGPNGTIKVSSLQGDKLDSTLPESILKNASSFKNISTGIVGSNVADSASGYSISFKHSEFVTDSCSVSEYKDRSTGNLEYSIYCTKTVHDFLPGYKIEK